MTYIEALASGEIEWGPSLRHAATWRRPSGLGAAVVRAVLHVLRRTGVLFPDPVRWIRIRGQFDLVHIHCLPVRFVGRRPPTVVSDSAGTFWHWTVSQGHSEQRVERLLRREGRVARRTGYLHPTANPAGEALVYFIPSGERLARRIGVDASTATVCAPGVPPARRNHSADGRTILFVGRAFAWKGGPEALEIFERVRTEIPDARLLVAGPEEPYADLAGVEWLGSVSRDRLYDDVYPRADIFLYPTHFDIAPLVVQEALAHGLPVVATNIMGLPDLVIDGETGRLFEPGDLDGAANAVIAYLRDRAALATARDAALRDYERRFSVAYRNDVLGAVYRSIAP